MRSDLSRKRDLLRRRGLRDIAHARRDPMQVFTSDLKDQRLDIHAGPNLCGGRSGRFVLPYLSQSSVVSD